MPSDLVLITGATGHVGFRVLVFALQAGYSVRAAIRSESKSAGILNAKSIKDLAPGDRLTFIVVPDILAAGAYDEAVKDVKYIIHVASPITSGAEPDQFDSVLIQPALRGTLGILESAHKNNKDIKRIVITASEVSIIPWKPFFAEETGQTFTSTDRLSDPPAPYSLEFEAYAASKVIAFNASEKFVATEKPSFDTVNIMPSFVIGKNELITDAKDILSGTNAAAFSQVLGHDTPFSKPSTTVFLDDVAQIHVAALDPKIPGNSHFLLNSEGLEGTNWDDAKAIVAKHFPKAVAAGIFANNGKSPTKKTRVDTSLTQEVFGITFKSYEHQIISVANHYLELVGFQEN